MSMSGKHVAITGCTSGIGRASALELASRGAELTLFYRNQEKGLNLQREIESLGAAEPRMIAMDMCDLSSVREAAAVALQDGRTLDVLLNNAGVVNMRRRETVDGFEETLAVNHFAPFLLTGELLPLLHNAQAGRIVNVSSDAHTFVRSMHFDDMQAEKNFRVFREYGRSKLANILFTRTLSARLASSPITVNCLHPGAVSTSLGKQNDGVLGKILPALLKPFFLSPEQGAATSLYLCCSDEVAGVSGQYFVKSQPRQPKPWACDDEAAIRLWEYTEACLGYRLRV